MSTTRREFVKTSAKIVAGATIASTIPGSLSCAKGFSPNDKIVLGLIGGNGMGYSDLRAHLNLPNIECAAICDVDNNVANKRAADVEKIMIDKEAKGVKVTYKKPKLYNDYRKLLEDKDIDAVIIGTPDHWHAKIMIDACQAKKDVYCEKPMGNSIEEVVRMEKAAKRYKRVVQVGQWQRSDPHFYDAMEFVHSGKLGKIRTVKTWCYQGWLAPPPVVADSAVPEGVDYDMWLGPATKRPFNKNRFHFQFRWFWDYAGGLMTDWGVHLIDIGLWGMKAGTPVSAMSGGGKYAFPASAAETPDTQQVIYEFGDWCMIWDHAMGIDRGPYNSDHGIAFIGNNGTLVVDRRHWKVIPEGSGDNKKMEEVPVTKSVNQGLPLHAKNFIDSMRTRNYDTNASVTIGKEVAKVAHMGNIAMKTGRKIYWDDKKKLFLNDEESTGMVTPVYKNGWELPKV